MVGQLGMMRYTTGQTPHYDKLHKNLSKYSWIEQQSTFYVMSFNGLFIMLTVDVIIVLLHTITDGCSYLTVSTKIFINEVVTA